MAREAWLHDPLTKILLQFLEQRKDQLTIAALETAGVSQDGDWHINAARKSAKTLAYREVINYVKTGNRVG